MPDPGDAVAADACQLWGVMGCSSMTALDPHLRQLASVLRQARHRLLLDLCNTHYAFAFLTPVLESTGLV